MEKPTNTHKKWGGLQANRAEANASVIYKAKHIDFPSSLVIRRLTKKLAKDFDIKTLPEKLTQAFSKKAINFKIVSSGLVKVGSFQAAQIRYEQLDSRSNKTFDNLVISLPMKWQTFHIAFRAEKSDFKTGEKDILKITREFLKSIFLQ